jgi:hypothetical protein
MNAMDVILVTWPNHPRRIEYFHRTVTGLRQKLTASRHLLRWLCSAESEQDPESTWHGDRLEALCREWDIDLSWRAPPASLGGNMNAGCKLARAEVFLLVQDDFELLEPLDLSPGAEFMARHPVVDLLRYSYYQHPQYGTQFAGEIEGWRLVNIDGFWPYGDDPQMRRPLFQHRWGPYIEDCRHGASEGDMLHRLVAGRATIAAADRSYFGHFGEVSAVPIAREHRPRGVSRSEGTRD